MRFFLLQCLPHYPTLFLILSMFVLLKGATKEQSFKIGQEIAEAVTATNPKPVKLKFEKVREM